jgi:preprotein translocase subunit SecG
VIYLFYTIHVLVCIFLILVVLLQQGKGADLSVFGGGSTQTAFGARSATTLLHKLTVTSFVLFICTTLLIGILQGSTASTSLMSDVLGQRLEETATADEDDATGLEEGDSEPGEVPETEPLLPDEGEEGGAGETGDEDGG